MVQVRGTVHDVSDNPDRVEKIIVRAVEPRMHGTTYITEEPTQFPVVDGVLDFNVLPGPCVVAFLRPHGATTYEKLLVPDVAEATFRECLDAAALAEEGTKSALEKVVRQIQEELNKAAPLVDEMRSLRTDVSNDRAAVDGFTKAAKASASAAASSETNAKTSETNAASSAASAKSQQESAKTHFNNTVKEAEKAASSAAAAKTSETNAASSASASASSASSSKDQADKSAASATQAASARDAAKTSETNAAGSAAAAKTSETNAAQSSSTANTHRAAAATQASAASESATQAATSRDAAKQSQSAAKTSETNANKHRQAAATSETNAATHKTNAGESAAAAASSAAEAKGHADRAEVAADPDGLRNEMTKQFAALVDGAPEDLDTIREIAEYAQENRDITDQLNAAIGNKADKGHTHTWASITGRPDIPVTDVGYRIRWADHAPNLYPAGVSVSMSATEQGWGAALAAGNPEYVDDGFVVILTIRDGTYAPSAIQMVYSYTNVARPVYIRKYNGEAAGWSNFRKLSDDGHKHDIADINGAASKGYVDSRPALFSGTGSPPSSISGAVAGDFWLDTSTMELYKITGV